MLQRNDLVFTMAEYERRLRQLRERMQEVELDAMLVTTPENICYLCGFDSPGHYYFNALVIPADGEPFAVPRQLEDSGYKADTWLEITRPYQDHEHPIDVLHKTLTEFNLTGRRIGYEKQCWFFTAVQQDRLFALAPNTDFVDCSMIVEAGRLIKSAAEIDLMRRVAATTDRGMQAGLEAVKAGVTENDIAAEIHYAMIKAGSHWPAIAPFVASGHRGAIGHTTWAGRVVQPDEMVMVEVSGCLHRYHAPTMRTAYVGDPPQSIRDAEQLVLQAFDAIRAAIKPGVPAGDVDKIGRDIISSGNIGGAQASRTAYSVGISLPPDWGEGYILSIQPHEPRLIQENMTFHLLPWVQVPGRGGISISETIHVTADGCELLTSSPRGIYVC